MRTFVPLVRRTKLLALVCTGVVIVSQLGASVAAFADEASYAATARQALIILKSTDLNDMHKTIATLKDAGIHPMHVIPPRVVIADVPAGVEQSALAISNVASVHRSAVTPIAAARGVDLATGAAAWNYLVSPELAAPLKIPPEARPLIGDAFEPPMPPVSQLLTRPGVLQAAPGTTSTSEFMIGKVAVGVILPESDGSGENWSSARQLEVFDKIVAGLNWWATKGGSAANLTFYYDQKFSVPTQYEPITRSGYSEADQDIWVTDIFQNMGYTSGDRFARARAYINNLRTSFGTDWCYTFIVVDSLNDSDGKFTSGYFAWAYLGGPYSIMTYDNDGWGISNMNLVASHETGHIFLAGDEYCSPGYACCDFDYYGYLNIYNGNCEDGNPSSVPCMMRSNENAVCQYTNGQIGWRDTDGDGKPDPVDNVVANTLNSHTTPTTETILTCTGTATDTPYDSPTRTDVTINKISAVKYRIDGGTWTDASASDGSFNEDSEGYTFTTPPLGTGQHRIDTQAYSSSGNVSAIAGQDVNIIPSGFLRVTISPQGAIDAGAQWRRVETSTWLNSGYTEPNVPVSSYTVECKEVLGWVKPANLPVSVSENQLTEADAVYTVAEEIIIGTGTSTWEHPLNTFYHDARTQTIYLAGEIGDPYNITALALYVTQVPGQTMNNFTIRMKHTDMSVYGSSPNWESSGWTTVYQTNKNITTTGWVQFDFTTPFAYNGTQNLMADISFNNSSYTTDGLCRYSTPGGKRTIYFYTDSDYGDPLSWSGRTPIPLTSTKVPNVKLIVESMRVDQPVFTPDGGVYNSEQEVTITCATPEATIHYTTNGLDPTESDPVIESGSSIVVDHSLPLKAKAWKSGWNPSSVKSADYTITGTVATPMFFPVGGTYTSPVDVTISCGTSGATIHYTTNGVDPTESDPVYTGPVHITSTTTLKARAWKSGWNPSAPGTETYSMFVTYVLTASAGPNGSIYPSGTFDVNEGNDQPFTAEPNAGYTVDRWYLDGNSVQNGGATYTLEDVTADHTVYVTFKELIFVISGYVFEQDGNTPVEGVPIQTDDNDITSVTDANGYYELLVDYDWSGIVTPQKEGYVFEPNGNTYTNVTQDYGDENYIATLMTFKIAGYVLEQNYATPINDVNVSAENGGGPWTSRYGGGSWLTDANGYYEVVVDYNWSGKVVPAKYAYAFEPNKMEYVNVKSDSNDQDYIGTLLTFIISGHIKNSCDVPIAGVLVDANNGGGQNTTDVNGFYEVWVDYNWSGTVTPTKGHHTFNPGEMVYVDVLADQTEQNYQAINIYDLDCDGTIGYGDLAVIAENWLKTPANINEGDLNNDNIVNFLDFAEFAKHWFEGTIL